MRNLKRNEKSYYALNFVSKIAIIDEDGNETGEYLPKYSKQFKFEAHISGAKGSSSVEVFGVQEEYDKVMVLSIDKFKEYKFDEQSVFFIDKKPKYDSQGYPLYDYRVKRIADSVNQVSIALEKVRD